MSSPRRRRNGAPSPTSTAATAGRSPIDGRQAVPVDGLRTAVLEFTAAEWARIRGLRNRRSWSELSNDEREWLHRPDTVFARRLGVTLSTWTDYKAGRTARAGVPLLIGFYRIRELRPAVQAFLERGGK